MQLGKSQPNNTLFHISEDLDGCIEEFEGFCSLLAMADVDTNPPTNESIGRIYCLQKRMINRLKDISDQIEAHRRTATAQN